MSGARGIAEVGEECLRSCSLGRTWDTVIREAPEVEGNAGKQSARCSRLLRSRPGTPLHRKARARGLTCRTLGGRCLCYRDRRRSLRTCYRSLRESSSTSMSISAPRPVCAVQRAGLSDAPTASPGSAASWILRVMHRVAQTASERAGEGESAQSWWIASTRMHPPGASAGNWRR